MRCDFRKQYRAIHKYTFLNCTLAATQLQYLMIRQHPKYRHSLSKLQQFDHWKQMLFSESQLRFLLLCKFKANLLKPMKFLFPQLLKKKLLNFQVQDLGGELLECLGFLHLSLLTQTVWGFALYYFSKEGFNQIICQAQLINYSVIEAGLYRGLMLRISFPSPTSCHHLSDYASLLVHSFSRQLRQIRRHVIKRCISFCQLWNKELRNGNNFLSSYVTV